ncbi:MAG: hypothetical protein U0V02_16295 [Anaerolineales bacterium]
MTEKERIASHIAMCKCCLLAEAMKNCPICLFNIGLAENVTQVKFDTPQPTQIQIMMFEPA